MRRYVRREFPLFHHVILPYTKGMSDKTIFEKIIDRDIPSTIVYEDEESIAFMDIMPVTKGHLLFVSKKPYESIQDVPDELLGSMFSKAKKLIVAMKEALGCDYVQVAIAGDEVPHFHIYLIPRHRGAKIFGEHRPEATYAEGEKQMFAEKITQALTRE